jgi:hypothetical protein
MLAPGRERKRRAHLSRLLGLFALLGLFLLLGASPAQAALTKGPCNGSVTIEGKRYTPANDTAANPVVVPEEEGVIVEYRGNTGDAKIKDHTGGIAVEIGPGSITVASWGHPHKKGDNKARGLYSLDEAYEKLPLDLVGLYKVEGFHRGKGGECEGFAMILIEGNPFGTLPGLASVSLTAVAGIGVAVAAVAKGAA